MAISQPFGRTSSVPGKRSANDRDRRPRVVGRVVSYERRPSGGGCHCWCRRGARSDERGGYAKLHRMPATTADRTQPDTTAYLICAAAWLVPGVGHLWLGRRQKGIVFL